MSFDDAFLRFPIIETQRTILREFNLENNPAAHLDIFSDSDVYEFFDYFPKNISEAEKLIRSTHKSFLEKRKIRWCIALKENKSETIGNIVLANFIRKIGM